MEIDRLSGAMHYNYSLSEVNDIATEGISHSNCLPTVTKESLNSFAVAKNSQSYAE
ncbi:MAG: hypothetical protein SWO11_06175 [Thermodesulfobacteriota bacterium]|nr:hypothetical protein [Thermodesulfobacteriota bacterium]